MEENSERSSMSSGIKEKPGMQGMFEKPSLSSGMKENPKDPQEL